MHWAIRKERVSCAELLLSLPISSSIIDRQTRGTSETALHKAARQGSYELIKILLEKGADRTLVSGHQQTALQVAEEMLSIEIAAKEKRSLEEKEAAGQASESASKAGHTVTSSSVSAMMKSRIEVASRMLLNWKSPVSLFSGH